MSKTFETKKKILDLLKEKDMSVTELSSQLDLAPPTVGQHISELVEMGAIDQIDNEHFKKVKLYKVSTTGANPMVARYLAGIIAIALIGSLLYFYGGRFFGTSAATPATTLYLGNSIKVGNITVQLSGMIPSNGVSLARFDVYNKGVLTNRSTYATGGSGAIDSNGTQLIISVQAIHNNSVDAIINLGRLSTTTATTSILQPPPLPVVSNYTTTLYPPAFPN